MDIEPHIDWKWDRHSIHWDILVRICQHDWSYSYHHSNQLGRHQHIVWLRSMKKFDLGKLSIWLHIVDRGDLDLHIDC